MPVQGKGDIDHQSSEKGKMDFQKYSHPCKDLAEETNYRPQKNEIAKLFFF